MKRVLGGLGVAGLATSLTVWSLGGSASATPVSLVSSSTPGVQARAATVPTDEASFRAGWMDSNVTQIDLANDITFAGPSCSPGTATRSSANDLTVNGNGHTLTLCTNAGGGVLRQTGTGALTFQDVTVTGGTATGGSGGAVFAGSGAVTVTSSTFSTNTAAANGGAVFAGGGAVTVTNSTFSTNSAMGAGAISALAAVTVTNSTFTANGAGTGGGGAISAGTGVTVTNSTFTANTAGGTGGGAIATGGPVTLAYSTLTGNVAAIRSAVFSVTSITSFGSVFVKPGGTGLLCGGPGSQSSLGFNFANETADSCSLNATGDSSLDANDPLLGALASNGGPTQTQLPQDGPSPLIDAIPNASCQTAPLATGIATDQRGLVRPGSGSPNCDIGAVEVQLPTALPPAPPAAVVVTPRFTG